MKTTNNVWHKAQNTSRDALDTPLDNGTPTMHPWALGLSPGAILTTLLPFGVATRDQCPTEPRPHGPSPTLTLVNPYPTDLGSVLDYSLISGVSCRRFNSVHELGF